MSRILNTFHGNFATNYGVEFEAKARDVFSNSSGLNVLKCGFLVHPDIPYLGCSPDGLIESDGIIEVLEIKCPVLGSSRPAEEIAENLDYLYVDEVSQCYCLKKRHKYYGQVQLCMFLTGANKCHFIVFSSFDNSFVNVPVPKDISFINKMYKSLSTTYFTIMLPFLNKS